MEDNVITYKDISEIIDRLIKTRLTMGVYITKPEGVHLTSSVEELDKAILRFTSMINT